MHDYAMQLPSQLYGPSSLSQGRDEILDFNFILIVDTKHSGLALCHVHVRHAHASLDRTNTNCHYSWTRYFSH